MDAPASPHQLTVFSQLLKELRNKTKAMQIKIIKAACETDLRVMLINRYPLKLTEDNSIRTNSITELVQEVERVSPNIKRIIKRIGDSN